MKQDGECKLMTQLIPIHQHSDFKFIPDTEIDLRDKKHSNRKKHKYIDSKIDVSSEDEVH